MHYTAGKSGALVQTHDLSASGRGATRSECVVPASAEPGALLSLALCRLPHACPERLKVLTDSCWGVV